MRPCLLYKDYDNVCNKKVWNEADLIQDLNLQYIFKAMALGDTFLYDTAKRTVLDSLTDLETISYRQNILKDCINNKKAIKNLYNITTDTIKESAFYQEYNKPNYARIISMPVKISNSVCLLDLIIKKLEELKKYTQNYKDDFKSEGFIRFFNQLTNFLYDEFIIKVKEHIRDLKLITKESCIIISSGLGNGMKGTDHILRNVSNVVSGNSLKKLHKRSINNVILIDNIRLEDSIREIEEAGLINILKIVNQFTGDMIRFLEELRFEIGFYAGCVNLYDELSEIDVPISYPIPDKLNKKELSFKGLYDLSLALSQRKRLIANNLIAIDKTLFIITGANQGGKSTYLRSIGIAQLLMQCGMFIPADYFKANLCSGIYTHFTREEDAQMNSGKLDEELLRMNNIINTIKHNSMVLMNEPFATTTERDGSIIAMDIINALIEYDVKVLFVTHLYEFSRLMISNNMEKAIFLRAERNENGSRTFNIKIGEPLSTSYGEDLFKSIIGELNFR